MTKTSFLNSLAFYVVPLFFSLSLSAANTGFTVDLSPTAPNCSGESFGSIPVRIFKEIFPCRLDGSDDHYNGPGGRSQLNSLPACTNQLSVTNGNSYSTDCRSFTINPNPPCTLMVNVISKDETCLGANNGSIEVTIINGTPPYDFQWSNNAGTLSQYNVKPGVYEISVTDANGCENSSLIFMGTGRALPDVMTGDIISNCGEDCQMLPLTFSGSGPFTLSYTITQANETKTYQQIFNNEQDTLLICPDELNLPSGTFLLEMTYLKDRRCDNQLGISMELENTAQAVDFFTTDLCSGDSLIIGNTVFNAAHTTGTVLIPNAASGGCDSLVEVSINFFPEATQLIEAILCASDSLKVGETMFNASHPSGTVLIPGSSAHGCDSVVQVNLEFYPEATEIIQLNLCAGDSLVIGDETFNQDRPSGSVLLAGASHTGCDSLIHIALNFNSSISTVVEETLCTGDSLVFGGEVFNASHPTGRLYLTTLDGCDSIVDIQLRFLPEVRANLSGDTSICVGATIPLRLQVSTHMPYTYQIRSDTGIISGTHSGGNLDLPQTPTETGTFILESISVEKPCPIIIDQALVGVLVSDPQLDLSLITDYHGFGVSCFNAQDGELAAIVTQGVAPYQITWSNGTQGALNQDLRPGSYRARVIDQIGCTVESSVSLEAPPPIETNAQGILEGCQDSAIPLIRIHDLSGGTGNYFYTFNDGPFAPIEGAPVELGPLDSTGMYKLTIRDENLCSINLEVMIQDSESLSMDLGPDQYIQLGDSVLLEATTNFDPTEWEWLSATGINQPDNWITYVAPTESTRYELSLTSESGCQIRDEIFIVVDTRVPVYLPNAFSPNNDGVNDFFTVFANEFIQQIALLEVYDRWGNQLFFRSDFPPNDPQFGWDGRAGGKQASAATYFWRVEISLKTGKKIHQTGEINLIR